MIFFSTISGCQATQQGDISSSLSYSIESSSYVYNIPKRYYSDGIKNIVKRSRQIKEITWIPVEKLEAFNSDYYFDKGVEVTGIPYSQPVLNGKFVIYQMTLEEFISESKVKGGAFYTEKGLYEEPSTYYGMDCSSFVSYAWNCRNRLTAQNLADFGDNKGNSLNSIQVGDALIKTGEGAHAVLVTGVKEDSKKNIVWIEITEQTPPLTKRTVYGKGELFTIEEFLSLYLKNGFKIYRNTDKRDDIPFTHMCVSPIGEYCDDCYSSNVYKNVTFTDCFADNFIFESHFSLPKDSKDISFSYAVSHIHQGWEKYITDSEHYIRLRNEPGGEESILLVSPGTFVTIFDKVYDSSGELWGKTKYNNKVGWLYLESSKYLGGDVEMGDEITIPDDACTITSSDEYEIIHSCVLTIPIKDFPKNKKLQVFATDSSGNKYLVGEYLNK
jgi:hypothetical protein